MESRQISESRATVDPSNKYFLKFRPINEFSAKYRKLNRRVYNL